MAWDSDRAPRRRVTAITRGPAIESLDGTDRLEIFAMQHDRGCICQECTSTSTTDTVLVGVLMITGVVIAISTGSKWFVAGALVLLAALVVRKLRGAEPRDRPPTRKGLN